MDEYEFLEKELSAGDSARFGLFVSKKILEYLGCGSSGLKVEEQSNQFVVSFSLVKYMNQQDFSSRFCRTKQVVSIQHSQKCSQEQISLDYTSNYFIEDQKNYHISFQYLRRDRDKDALQAKKKNNYSSQWPQINSQESQSDLEIPPEAIQIRPNPHLGVSGED